MSPQDRDDLGLQTRIAALEREKAALQTQVLLLQTRLAHEQARDNAELRASEERYRLLADSMEDFVTLASIDRQSIYISPSYLRFSGYTLEQLTSTDFAVRVHPDDLERVELARQANLRGEPTRVEWRCRRADGVFVWLETRATPICNSAGVTERIVTCSRDISERKQYEEALRLSEIRFRTALQGAPVTVFNQDSDLRYTWVYNPMARSVEEVLGRTDHDLCEDPKDAQALEIIKRRVLNTGKGTRELSRIQRGGAEHFYDLWVEPLWSEGRVVGVTCACWDITDRRQAELEQRHVQEQLLKTQQFQAVSVMAGGIAHDFNNLLTGILGYAALTNLALPDNSPLKNHLEQIEICCQRAANLCKQMLAYAGKGRYVLEPVNLTQVLGEMQPLFHTFISPRANLQLDLSPTLPTVEGDPSQLRQLLINLLTNASEALEEQPGEIRVRTGTLHPDKLRLQSAHVPDQLTEGEYVLVEVQDTGCGISQEILARIFDPFYSTKFVGRGLGLAAVLGIVRSHRGTIQVQTEPGRGSTFQVLFPVLDRKTHC